MFHDAKAKCPDCESYHAADDMIEAKRGLFRGDGKSFIGTTLVCESCASEEEIEADREGEY